MRWLCDLVGYGPDAFGLLTSGGVMANFMGMTLARDIHLGRLLGAGRRRAGAMLDGVRVYTSDQTHFSVARALDLLGFPPETLVVVAVGRALPAPRRPGRRGRRARPGGGPDPVRDRRRGRIDEHRARSTWSASWPMSPRPRTCGSTSTRRTAAARACRRATAAGCRTSTGPIRSPSTRTSGSSRPTTSAGCWSATGAHLGAGVRRPRARVLPRRRGRRPTDAPTATTTTATSSTSTSSASRAPGAGARSSSGCPGSTSAPRGSGA